MPDLRKTIQILTESFADAVASEVASAMSAAVRERSREFTEGVLAAIRASSLSDIVAGAGEKPSTSRQSRIAHKRHKTGKRGNRGKRTNAEIDSLAEEIMVFCKKHPGGVKAEEMRAVLKVDASDLQSPIARLLTTERITKTGQARATLYFAAA